MRAAAHDADPLAVVGPNYFSTDQGPVAAKPGQCRPDQLDELLQPPVPSRSTAGRRLAERDRLGLRSSATRAAAPRSSCSAPRRRTSGPSGEAGWVSRDLRQPVRPGPAVRHYTICAKTTIGGTPHAGSRAAITLNDPTCGRSSGTTTLERHRQLQPRRGEVPGMSRRLRSEAGFSLPELLITLTIAGVIMLAAFALVEFVMKRTAEAEQRVEATQRGRIGMDMITRQLRSQVCLGAGTRRRSWTARPTRSRSTSTSGNSLRLDAARAPHADLRARHANRLDHRDGSRSPTPPTGHLEGGDDRACCSPASPATPTSDNNTIPIFQYRGFNNLMTPAADLHEQPPVPPSPAATPASVVKIKIAFRASRAQDSRRPARSRSRSPTTSSARASNPNAAPSRLRQLHSDPDMHMTTTHRASRERRLIPTTASPCSSSSWSCSCRRCSWPPASPPPTATCRCRATGATARSAYAAAEAGLNFYQYHLDQDNDYWLKCTNVRPPNGTEPSPVNQQWDGTQRRASWRNVPGSDGAVHDRAAARPRPGQVRQGATRSR